MPGNKPVIEKRRKLLQAAGSTLLSGALGAPMIVTSRKAHVPRRQSAASASSQG